MMETFLTVCSKVRAMPWTYSSKRALRAHVSTWLECHFDPHFGVKAWLR